MSDLFSTNVEVSTGTLVSVYKHMCNYRVDDMYTALLLIHRIIVHVLLQTKIPKWMVPFEFLQLHGHVRQRLITNNVHGSTHGRFTLVQHIELYNSSHNNKPFPQ